MKVRISLVSEPTPGQTGPFGSVSSSEMVEEVTSTLAAVLRAVPARHLIHKAAVVTTYLELLITHPSTAEYKQCLLDSLNDLASVLMSDGLTKLSQKTLALSLTLSGVRRGSSIDHVRTSAELKV